MLNENIRTQWLETRTSAIELWHNDIERIMVPELEKRGIQINSRAVMDPVAGKEIALIWFCSKNEKYIEIKAMTHLGFMVEILKNKEILARWPSTNYEERQTIAALLEWLDYQEI